MSEVIRTTRTVLLLLLLLAVSVLSAFGHGKEEHGEKADAGSHMQAMKAVKSRVPAIYRIMERTPVFPDSESLANGKTLFRQNCTVCHGKKGDGQGPAASSLPTSPANFLDTHHSAMYNAGEKYWIIGNGTGTTGMPSFKALDPAERWDLVNYIFSLQTPEKSEHSSQEKSHHD
ncbi:MAG: cytochrome c [Geopsychrobacter sp.]|nr:cytochrome c [Geopsychrobacter sp.]